MPKKEATIEPLADYIARIEKQAQPLAVVKLTHPEATDRIHEGVYSGIRLSPGEPSATLSDGSTIN